MGAARIDFHFVRTSAQFSPRASCQRFANWFFKLIFQVSARQDQASRPHADVNSSVLSSNHGFHAISPSFRSVFE